MFRYAQINEDGFVVSDSYLSDEVTADKMIAIAEDFVLTSKKYVGGEWGNTFQSLLWKFQQSRN